MKEVIEVNILEQKLYIKTADDADNVKRAADYLNKKIEEVKQTSKVVSTLNIALLAAMNITDDYFQTKEQLKRLEDRSQKLLETINERMV